MYCITCGKPIPEISKFCSFCGQLQEDDKKLPNRIVESGPLYKARGLGFLNFFVKVFGISFTHKFTAFYLAWFFLHLGILLIFSEGIFDNSYIGATHFWPLGEYTEFKDPGVYDITEFSVYTIFPIAILLIWTMISSLNSKK